MIKAVTFDLWNTLISERNYDDLRAAYLAKALSEQNIIKEYREIIKAVIKAHDRAHRVGKEEDHRFVTVNERLGYILEDLEVSLPESAKEPLIKEFKEVILENPPLLVEGVQEVLQFLDPQYRMAIVCDSGITPGRILRKILDKVHVLGFFGATVFSDEVGYNKPHRLMFETALRRLHVNASKTVHVGDSYETDIVGAKSMGMKAVWFNRGGTVKTGKFRPDFEISFLARLIEVLRELC